MSLDALKSFADRIRQKEPGLIQSLKLKHAMGTMSMVGPSPYPNGIDSSSAMTLHPNAGSSPRMSSPSKNPAPTPANLASASTAQSTMVDTNPGRASNAVGPPSATPSGSTPSSTPRQAPATLKRKTQNDAAPDTGPPPKRMATRRKSKAA